MTIDPTPTPPAESAAQSTPLLTLRDVSKSFGPVDVIKNVTIDVFPGQVEVLLGENGAGKSTIIKMMSGIYQPSSGHIEVDGRVVDLPDVKAAERLGIATIHQELNLVPHLSVAENIVLGRTPSSFGVVRRSEMNRIAQDALDRIGLKVPLNQPVGELGVAKQQLVEIAKALEESGDVIVLQGIPGSSASRDRGQGFKDGIGQFSGVKVVAEQTAEFDRAKGLDVATNLLQANSGTKGIFAENDEMALGAIEALGAKAGKDVMVVGFDGTEDGLKAIKAGTMLATIAQQPAELGKQAVIQAAAILEGKDAEKEIQVDVVTVTEKNVDEHLK